MAYQARNSSEDKELEKARNDANNTKNVRNAADVAIASKNPYGVAIGGGIKAADAVTGGKASEALGKGMTFANKVNKLGPLNGKKLQDASNKLAESGASDKIGKAASVYNKANGAGPTPGETPNQVKNNKTSGGEQESSSLPSSRDKNNPNYQNSRESSSRDSYDGGSRKKSSVSRDDSFEDEEGGSTQLTGSATITFQKAVVIAVVAILPCLFIILIFLAAVLTASGLFSEFDDAFGASGVAGEENGNMAYSTANKEQQSFYERINTAKLRYQSQGKSFDAYKISAVYHVINANNSKFTYNNMTDSVISEIADSMFSGNIYNESTFKSNLASNIFSKYVPGSSQREREIMADDVIQYIKDYENLIGKTDDGINSRITCASTGSCTYDIKGYYIEGKGNVAESIQVKDLYVRLMQCGVGNGHNYGGTFGKPLEGEALVPFEKYILGVAYQEIGEESPAEAIKAQMVAARSYILARHADMGGWRTLKEENGRWIIQVASCTQDQVYCDPDQGCSSNDGQWGQIHSGLNHGTGFSREPMSSNSPLRTYASQTTGEVLINKDGYIVYTGYLQDEQDTFITLAKKGLNYKQILLQVYNQGSRNYGASDILRASCSNSGSASCGGASGDFVNWKQAGEVWSNVPIGNSGKNIGQIGCLVTSVAIQIARSGVPTNISDFNPGTFVEYLNSHGGFDGYGNFNWSAATLAAPSFQYQDQIFVSGMSREQKLDILKGLVSQPNTYVVAEVKGNTGQHWVAIDSINGDTITMMDPGREATDLWGTYNWANTSAFSYYKVQS